MENLSTEVMSEMAAQYGTVEMSLTVAAITLIAFGCLATLSGVLTNRRSHLERATQEWESLDAEDQTSWTELMRQLA
ncbi:MAG: hypothetical protein VX589_03550 [Myxococcota bacterium]|nr:hypothetical protein [Myxococcota bacterium]